MEAKKAVYTNAAQFQLMVRFMENHTDLAKGHLNTANAKNVANNLWNTLAEDLNAAGPPQRDVAGWKKVWADYKTHLKAKLRKNKRSLSATGGGLSQFNNLTSLEEVVVQLLSMEQLTEGISSGKKYLCPETDTTSPCHHPVPPTWTKGNALFIKLCFTILFVGAGAEREHLFLWEQSSERSNLKICLLQSPDK